MSVYRSPAQRDVDAPHRWVPLLGWRAGFAGAVASGVMGSAPFWSLSCTVIAIFLHFAFMQTWDFYDWRRTGRECRERYRGAGWRGRPVYR